jgi:arylsulfatase A-like enzyme
MKASIYFLLVTLASAVAADRPNLVFLLTDDQTTYSLGCYGNKEVKTPNIDRLASEGMTFDRHYDTTAICMASRASIMTGLYEYRHGCNFTHGALVREHWEKAYPKLLRKAGYRTAIAGKIGFEVCEAPGEKGKLPEGDFDSWGAGPGQTHYQTAKNPSMKRFAKEFPHATRAYGAFAKEFIMGSAKSEQPFCLSISFKSPHKPVEPDPIDDDVYKGMTFTKPANYGRDKGKHFAKQSQGGRQYERFHSWGYADDYDAEMGKYFQQIYAVDAAVGMVRQALADSETAANTIVIFTSDNGFLCGSHGYGSKVLPYEEASRAPLIVVDPRHPKHGQARRCGALTGNVDFSPTLLDYAGVSIPEGIDGRSLRPLLDDPKASIHESLPLINVWGPSEVYSFGVVTKTQKYIFWPDGSKGNTPNEELYHLDKDPHELEATSLGDEALPAMRQRYDRAVDDWKVKAVPYHRYQPFGRHFDRSVPWSEKAPARPGT